jgi:pyrroloquinoline-quinone synthase
MNPHDFLEKIDNTIRQYPLICHPFYQAWMQGALTRDDLREYAMEYYNQVAAFPMYLREFARRLPAGELRHRVHQNLCEEEGNGNGPDKRTHATIWMAFAEEVGASLFEIHNRKPLPKTQQLVDLFFELAQAGSEAEALAAFYVYESQVPGLAAS